MSVAFPKAGVGRRAAVDSSVQYDACFVDFGMMREIGWRSQEKAR